ncbi:MAG: DUF2726 domain-containing protein [Clostridia bacterium]|nr:DUF2726 domain-containing protein [Clostridia bacterium]
MNFLLGIFVDAILPIIIIALAITASIILFKYLRKNFDKPINNVPTASPNAKVKLKSHYCTEEEMRFLDALHKALPRECISFPRVGVSQLIEPKDNMNDYKAIADKFVDIVVFLRKDMKPILVIDLYQSSPVAQQLKKFDENITNVLKSAKIPIIHKQLQEEYKIDELTIEILNNLDSSTLTYLKTISIGAFDKK